MSYIILGYIILGYIILGYIILGYIILGYIILGYIILGYIILVIADKHLLLQICQQALPQEASVVLLLLSRSCLQLCHP